MRLDWHTVDAIMKAAVERGLKFLKEWITKVNRSRLEPMKKVARVRSQKDVINTGTF